MGPLSFLLMRKCLLFFFFLPAVACMPNYFLLHPLVPAPGIYRESGFSDQGWGTKTASPRARPAAALSF